MRKDLSYILQLRNSLKEEYRHMALFQNGSAIIVVNENDEILLQERADRNLWCIPGGLQELGETFEQVAIRELKEETGLDANIEDLKLVAVVSGESRKNEYPNGDQVYNNTVLYVVRSYSGMLGSNYEEIIDLGNRIFKSVKESITLSFFSLSKLPSNLMDKDLVEIYKNNQKKFTI